LTGKDIPGGIANDRLVQLRTTTIRSAFGQMQLKFRTKIHFYTIWIVYTGFFKIYRHF
jgi:hypothetical protein